MPLLKSGLDSARETNIREMIDAGHPPKQAEAAAYSNQRKYRASGGLVPDYTPSDAVNDAQEAEKNYKNSLPRGDVVRGLMALDQEGRRRAAIAEGYSRAAGGQVPWFVRQEASHLNHPLVGPVRGITPGRADKVPARVPSGSYVLPSASISHLGQNNTESGFHVADKMFRVAPTPHLPKMRADGGGTGEQTTDIMISPGEYVVHPDKVREIGGGDLNQGHKTLDLFVKELLKQNAAEAKKIPGPAKD